MTEVIRKARWSALAVAVIYVVVGSLWILFSDRILLGWVDDPAALTRLQTWKGWIYVMASGVLVYALTRGALAAVARMERSGRGVAAVLDTIPSRVAWRGRDGVYLGCNAGFAQDAGLESREAIRGLTDGELPWSPTTPDVETDMLRALETKERVVGREAVTASHTGQLLRIRYSVAPVLDEAGELEGTLFCYDDVTDRAAAREQLRQAQKMNEIGQLTSGVAHDFNNVLSVIGANAELAAEGALEEDEARRALEEVGNASRSAGRMVRRLLSLARQADMEPSPTDVADLIGSLSSMFSRILTPLYPYRLEVNGKLPLAMADPTAVEQALLNLITNARDSMEGGGRIRVCLGVVDLEELAGDACGGRNGSDGFWTPPSPTPPGPGRYVTVSVSDEGPGIETGKLASVFQPFFTTKPRGAGTGLGLAMVQGLMEQGGGGVQVRTALGEGTTMRLLLPVCEEPVEAGAARIARGSGASTFDSPGADPRPAGTAGKDPDLRTGLILVVDDHPELRSTMGRVLRRYGWEVLEAENGARALELVEGHPEDFSLILSDLTMPEMGGLELHRELRSRGVRVPFVVTSGLAELREVAGSEEEASLPFIPKPWTPVELVERLREWI